MRLKLEKTALWLINFSLCAFFAFAILVFFEQFGYRGWPWYSRSLRAWPILLCFILGTAAGGRKVAAGLLLPVSCLVSGALIYYIFPWRTPFDIAYVVFAAVLGAGLFAAGMRGAEPFPPRLAIASTIAYIVALLYFSLHGYAEEAYAPVSWCALAAFLLALYSQNSAGLSGGVHNVKGGEVMALPSGIRGKNLALLSLFIIAAVLIGNLGFLHRLLGGISQWLIRGIASFLLFLSGLNGSGEAAPPSPTPTQEQTQLKLPAGETGDPIFAAVYITLLLILGAVFAAFLVFGISRAGRRGGFGRLAGLLRNLLQKKNRTLEYEDSVERTDDLKGLIKRKGRNARDFFKKIAGRPERFEDMPDNRKKVRFAYKMLLKSGRVAGWSPSATPGEVGLALKTESLRALAACYSAARYDEISEVSDIAALSARKALDDLKGRYRHG
jgi:hypothetical protein